MNDPDDPDSHQLEDLRQQLHQATDRFHQARLEWEKWLQASEYRHEERVDAARDNLRQAEREVEDLEGKIKEALSPPPTAAAPADEKQP
jgi:chromosome segregation ATPase